jgi:hypothetical protein
MDLNSEIEIKPVISKLGENRQKYAFFYMINHFRC